MRAPAIAVVGRQNVGKSTLVNRLFGSREAIAHEMPGVTRDRVELETTWGDRTLKLIDTGGFAHDAKGIEALVSDQAERAAREADVVLLVVDVQTGPVEEDALLARRLRRADVPVLVVVNKVDTDRDESDVQAFLTLGLGDPVPVSALHGRGSGDLLDQLVAVLPDDETEEAEEPEEPRFAIVGRPNVGKSSLFNRLVGEERSVVFEEAGTTRDAVDALVTWPDGPVRFVDTAGFRRPSKVQGVEYYSFLRAERAIERAHVALLVLDASQGFTGEDKRIAARVMEVGRGLVVVANKWDLVEEREIGLPARLRARKHRPARRSRRWPVTLQAACRIATFDDAAVGAARVPDRHACRPRAVPIWRAGQRGGRARDSARRRDAPVPPLHHLVFARFPDRRAVPPAVLVMTSGNLSEEPILLRRRRRLGPASGARRRMARASPPDPRAVRRLGRAQRSKGAEQPVRRLPRVTPCRRSPAGA